MKRFFVWFFLLCLSMTPAASALSLARESGPGEDAILSLIAEAIALRNSIETEGETVYLEQALFALAEAEAEEIALLSLSPSGEKLLCSVENLYFLYDLPGRSATLLLPDYEGSVFADEFSRQDFRIFLEGPLPARMEASSVVWSPDEQYLAVNFWRDSMLYMKMNMDLYVFDLEAGRIRINRSFPGKSIESASIIQLCFSQDSRILYHTVVGLQEEYTYALWAYAMDTGEAEFISAAMESGKQVYGDLPGLRRLPDGRLMQIADSIRPDQPGGYFLYDPSLPDSREFVPVSAGPLRPWDMCGDLLFLRGSNLSHYAAMTDRQGNALFILDPTVPGQAKSLPAGKLFDGENMVNALGKSYLPPEFFPGQDMGPSWIPENPGYPPYAGAPSPNGTEALLLLREPQDMAVSLVILDMESKDYAPVQADDLDTAAFALSWPRYQLGLIWAENDLVLLHTMEGGQLYHLSP